VRAVATILTASLLFVPGAVARHQAPRCGPFFLVQLPSLGTLTWRTTTPNGQDWHGLAYKPTPPIATTELRLWVGGRVVRRTVNDKAVVLPLSPNRFQAVTLSQMTEPGTLRASVRVDFKPGVTYTYCAPYMPPGLAITLHPRS
jgi:hypothetical protein